ncbi:MAG: IS3 family transposase [Spirochaetaceae bacterium JB067]
MKKTVVTHLIQRFGVSVRRACRIALLSRNVYQYTQKPNDDEKIVEAMKEILSKNSKYGCTMVHLKLRQKGILINHKRTEQIYKEQGFQLRSSRRRKSASRAS